MCLSAHVLSHLLVVQVTVFWLGRVNLAIVAELNPQTKSRITYCNDKQK